MKQVTLAHRQGGGGTGRSVVGSRGNLKPRDRLGRERMGVGGGMDSSV
jgi:hypothetical protein